MADPQAAVDILTPIKAEDAVKGMAVEVFQDPDRETFEKRLGALPLPDEVKRKLWDAKFATGPTTPAPATTPTIGGNQRIGASPSPGWQMMRQTLPMVGMVLGGAGGAALGSTAGPVGTFWGGVSGAGAGAAAGESVELGLEWLGKKLGLATSLQAPSGAASPVNRMGSAINTGMVGEAAAPVLQAGLTKAFAPFKDDLVPYAKEAIETFRDPRGRSTVLGGDVSRSQTLAFAQKIAQSSLAGRQTIEAAQSARDVVAENKVLSVLDSIGPSVSATEAGVAVKRALPAVTKETSEAQATLEAALGRKATGLEVRAAEQAAMQQSSTQEAEKIVGQVGPATSPKVAGQTVRTLQAEAIKTFREKERAAWKIFTEASADIPMDTPKLSAFMEGVEQREAGAILPNAGVTAGRKVEQLMAEEPVENLFDSPAQLKAFNQLDPDVKEGILATMRDPPLSAAQFSKTVSDLGRLTRSLQKSAQMDPVKYNAQKGLAEKLYSLARADLETALKQNPVAREAYAAATTETRMGNQQLFNEEVRRVIKMAPEKVAASLLKKNNSTAIEMTTGAVGQAGMKGVRSAALRTIVEPDPRTNQINWIKVAQKLANYGDDTLSALFPEGQHAALKRIANGVIEADRVMKRQALEEQAAVSVARRALAEGKGSGDVLGALRRTTAPESVTKLLFRRDNVTMVNALRDAIGPEAFANVQYTAMNQVLHADAVHGNIDWPTVLKSIDRIDPQTLEAFYPKGQMQEVKRIARLMVQMKGQVKNVTGSIGDLGIIITQWGALAGALGEMGVLAFRPESGSFARLGGEGAFLLGPGILSKVLASPVGMRYLTTGFKAPLGSKEAMRAGSALVSFIQRERAMDQPQEQETPTP